MANISPNPMSQHSSRCADVPKRLGNQIGASEIRIHLGMCLCHESFPKSAFATPPAISGDVTLGSFPNGVVRHSRVELYAALSGPRA